VSKLLLAEDFSNTEVTGSYWR